MATKWEFRKFLNLLGYIAIMLIAVAWIIGFIFKKGTVLTPHDVATSLIFFGNLFAYFITAVAAFYYARSKRSIWYLIAYIVAIVLIVLFILLAAFV